MGSRGSVFDIAFVIFALASSRLLFSKNALPLAAGGRVSLVVVVVVMVVVAAERKVESSFQKM